ncbi:hypothetical protein [Mycobacteroides abscessus]|uniref:hypothetical protein n=1 Tax=Mycobacteroides abscessus TaxID=36809 RepID=UPI0010557AB6|nr:hypothetical protein [Mycobacteroides abscessus]
MPTAGDGLTLTDEQRQSLSASWLVRFVSEAGYDVSQMSLSFSPFIIGPQVEGFHIEVTRATEFPWITVVASDPARQEHIDELARCSGDRAVAGDFGGHVWYSATLVSEPSVIALPYMDRLLEQLMNQSRFVGWGRISSEILLHFREELPEGQSDSDDNPFVVHRSLIEVHIAVPGPARGPLTEPIAHRCLEEVAAACTFFLGRAVDFPPVINPAEDGAVADLNNKRSDPNVGTLTRNGVMLDIYEGLLARGGLESMNRVRNALLSYDSAIRQHREQVALILYVVAAECLTNPYQSWKTERLTTRFIKFFDELMPSDLDALVQHNNFEAAFGISRGNRSARALRREFLSTIYNQRSEPVHEGLSTSFQGFGGIGGPAQLRRALASQFAQSAILRFLESPRTTLIGHPATAPEEI